MIGRKQNQEAATSKLLNRQGTLLRSASVSWLELLTSYREERRTHSLGYALESTKKSKSSVTTKEEDTAQWYAEEDTRSKRLLNAEHRVAWQRYLDPTQDSRPNYEYNICNTVEEFY